MTATENISPSRDITVWATSEELPPQHLFASIEEYRTFVKRWRALYAELSNRNRAHRIVGRYEQAVWTRDYLNKCGKKCGIRPGRKEEAELNQPALNAPRSPDLAELVLSQVPKRLLEQKPGTIYYATKEVPYEEWLAYHLKHRAIENHATYLLQNRAAGKRWVKHYHPWPA